MKDLLLTCPNEYRNIQAYQRSDDGKLAAIFSGGHALIYDSDAMRMYCPRVIGALSSHINRISFNTGKELSEILFWHNGRQVARSALSTSHLGELVGIYPEVVRLDKDNDK